MFRDKTTIVIGAGASCELGLPSGVQLKSQILRLLSPSTENIYGFSDPVMIEIMRSRVAASDLNAPAVLALVKTAAERIRHGLPLSPSIDNFLHSHNGQEELVNLGKLAIAICISRAEHKSKLFKPALDIRDWQPVGEKRSIDITNSEISATWYHPFAQLLMSEIQFDRISSIFANLRFVIFNYDRCFEEFIWKALQNYFSIDEQDAASILSSVNFIHPYGQLGPLPWQNIDDAVPLGDANTWQLANMPAKIRTFTESINSKIGQDVKNAVAWAETIVILGFGYLDQNIQLLTTHKLNNVRRMMSTAYGISAPDCVIMMDTMARLGGMSKKRVLIEPGSRRSLFDNFRLHLSLG